MNQYFYSKTLPNLHENNLCKPSNYYHQRSYQDIFVADNQIMWSVCVLLVSAFFIQTYAENPTCEECIKVVRGLNVPDSVGADGVEEFLKHVCEESRPPHTENFCRDVKGKELDIGNAYKEMGAGHEEELCKKVQLC
ncbi:hypothetical protein Ddc_01548 [Ditylenchus destructor]|nr:hypothetical protein Ddc_01548 [Ditylenchus destructor]